MQDVVKNLEIYHGRRSLGIAGKMEFQSRNIAYHHIHWYLEDGVIEYIQEIFEMIPAEAVASQQDRELYEIVKTGILNRDSPYCLQTTLNGQSCFEYNTTTSILRSL